jgi:hypothetical protein
VDLTDRHGATLELTARLVAGGREVVGLHVIEVIRGLTREEDPDFYRRLEEKANRHVGVQVEALRGKNVAARGEVRYGNRSGKSSPPPRGRGPTSSPSPRTRPTQRVLGGTWLAQPPGRRTAACPVLLVK